MTAQELRKELAVIDSKLASLTCNETYIINQLLVLKSVLKDSLINELELELQYSDRNSKNNA